MIHASIRQMAQMLTNLSGFLDQGATLAEEKSFPVANLLTARLAPDMFTLIKQVQSAADTAKFAAARLSGQTAPSDPDTEATLEELKARIAKTVAYIEGFSAADFAGAEERPITLPFLPKPARGADYFVQFAQANFYFHVSMAYAILRHNGAPLGKMAFIGRIDLV